MRMSPADMQDFLVEVFEMYSEFLESEKNDNENNNNEDEDEDDEYELLPTLRSVRTFDGALTMDKGLILTMDNGDEFQLPIVHSKIGKY